MARPPLPEESPANKPAVRKPLNAVERLRRAEQQAPSAASADHGLNAESRVAPAGSDGRHSNRAASLAQRTITPPAKRSAFTLVEILVAMVVTLILLGIVVTIFGLLGQNVSASRSIIEMSDQLRATKQRLQLDLIGATARMLPPLRPEEGLGYFEIIEGPVGRLPPNTKWVNDETYNPALPVSDPINVAALKPDTTVGDPDDIVMLTTRSRGGETFLGRARLWNGSAYVDTSLQSQVAEVVWFVRGTTLYRRQLLVRPDLNAKNLAQPSTSQPYYSTLTATPQATNFYAIFDLSAHAEGKIDNSHIYDLSPSPPSYKVVANSLADLTKRENRFAHAPIFASATKFGWPHDTRNFGTFYSPRPYGQTSVYATTGRLGLPTLRECAHPSFPLPGTMSITNSQTLTVIDSSGNRTGDTSSKIPADPKSNNAVEFDAWTNPNPWVEVEPATGTLQTYYVSGSTGIPVAEDIILTHVLSFDVRVWDPTAPQFADSSGNVYSPGDALFPGAFISYVQGGSSYSLVSRGAYVDLYYAAAAVPYASAHSITLSASDITNLNSFSAFSGPGLTNSGLYVGSNLNNTVDAAVYDTGSFHYERDGIDQDAANFKDINGNPVVVPDQATNGIDDNLNGLVDDVTELEAPPPYTAPLRGVQIKIRCFEPDSRQIREVTVVQEFVPQ